MSSGGPARRREDWQQLISEQKQSGLTVKAFCEKHGVGEALFYSWRKRVVAEDQPAPFALVATNGVAPSAPMPQPLQLFMTQNQDLSDVQRINAVMLANKLLAPQLRQLRWYLKDLHWDDAALLRTSISNVTFMSGDISRAAFSDVSFGGVLWNESPLNGHPGLMLSSLDFNKCRFDGGWFRGTGSVGVRFTNCRFQGTSLDVRNMGATSFHSLQANPSSSVITDEVSVFENVVISRCVPHLGLLL